MKLIVFAMACLLVLCTLASCSKSMLEEKVYSQPVIGSVSGPDGAALLTNGIYGFLQFYSYYAGNHYLLDTEAGTDEFYCAWGEVDEVSWGGAQNFINMNAAHYQVELKWNSLYKIIAQCNIVINQYASATEPAIKQNVAQARFWRAYTYYKLYNVYGAIPLIKGGEDQSNGIAKTGVAEIESFIEDELKRAMATPLPLSYPSSEYGRPTIWAAKAFLARFYLDRHRWQEASDLAKDVIDKGGFKPMPNYQDIFGQNGNEEVILAINHLAQSNKGNKYIALSMEAELKAALGIKGVSASNGYGMSTQFYRSFAPNDKRIAPYDKNTGKGIAIAGIILDAKGNPAYGNKDKPQTVEDALHRVVTCKWPVIQNIPRGEDAPLNMPLLRLGETLLTYAEAQNELNNVAEAAIYVDKIRERAGLPKTTATDKLSMRKAILDERGWELYHEGYRREDLMRAGSEVYLAKMNEKAQFYLKKPLFSAADAHRILNPIPASALRLNPLLK